MKTSVISKVLLIILLLSLSVKSYYVVSQKEELFVDEVYSFLTSNNKYIDATSVVEAISNGTIKEYIIQSDELGRTDQFTYEEFLKDCYVDAGGFDYFNAYFVQMADTLPPLYYLFLHTICSITKSPNLILNGFILNIFFLLLTCFCLYKLIIEISDDNLLALIIVGFYGLSYEFANNVCYFRMYSMCTLWFVLLLYLNILWSKTLWEDKKYMYGICIVQFLAMFTHQFSLLYISPFSIYTLFKVKGRNGILNKYLKCNGLSVVLYLIMWPCMLFQIGKGSGLHSGFAIKAILSRLYVYSQLLIDSMFACNIIYFVAFIVSVMSLSICYCKKFQIDIIGFIKRIFIDNQTAILIITPAVFYYVSVAIISPWASFRYQSPLMPILCVCIFMMLSFLLQEFVKDVYRYLILLMMTILFSVSWKVSDVTSLYKAPLGKDAFQNQYSKNEAIILDCSSLMYCDIPLNYNHPMYIRSDDKHANQFFQNKLNSDQYTLYVSKFTNLSVISNLLEGKNYFCEKIDYSPHFWDVYSLKKSCE